MGYLRMRNEGRNGPPNPSEFGTTASGIRQMSFHGWIEGRRYVAMAYRKNPAEPNPHRGEWRWEVQRADSYETLGYGVKIGPAFAISAFLLSQLETGHEKEPDETLSV